MGAILKTEGLTYIYGEGTPFEVTAVDDVSLEIAEGRLTGIIGHTGSGKSTFLQHLNGLLKPRDGRVLLDGRDIWAEPKKIREVRFRVGLVFQYPEYQLFEETVYKDIAFGPSNMDLSEDEIDRRVREAAHFAGLSEELLGSSPFELSGGQKRRAAIAGVMAMRPEVLILDEPTAGLDPVGRELMLQNIKDYQREANRSVILVTHSMNDIASIADDIIVLSHGKSVFSGPLDEVFSRGAELAQMGLDIPDMLKLMHKLEEAGLKFERPVYTVSDMAAALKSMIGGGTDA